MSESFIGQIKIFAGNFAPRGYSFCNGGLLPIAQNTALFAILGTTYGGDGRTTLGLPDLQGRAPMHAGSGPGLTRRLLGGKAGAATVALTAAELPPHNHLHNAVTLPANQFAPGGATDASRSVGGAVYFRDAPNVEMGDAIQPSGGGQAHQNRQPYLGINFIIALQGTFPS